jgi:Protein kinase domain
MAHCAACAIEIPDASRFCLQCGKPAGALDPDSVETIAEPLGRPVSQSATTLPNERFSPGTLLASRYRIVSRLGKGGMGEVFRADDLILGQPVALKFLPQEARGNLNLLKRFYDEVRIARQISHKNVCRVYDIGEIEGQPYLSMEYIDGEDLAGLLRRISRLPADKATEFARKLCAGVAAAHAQGVLHRDLKPANIMIDARGELRVTDFGLAGIAEELQGPEIRNGTPAYMAPEQLTGKEVSVQSDLYAVGLILYEMFTGKPAFEANTLAEMMRLRRESRVTNPSTLVADLDKSVERAILRCLEADPKARPVSALAVAALLAGGDPLAAALAEGETPTPEAVAAAGSTDALPLKFAIPALVGICLVMVALCLIIPRLNWVSLIPMENPPEVLTAKAREIARGLGYTDRYADWAAAFFVEPPNLEYLLSKGHNRDEWGRILAQPPSGLAYWYRQSPKPMVAERSNSYGAVRSNDPPVTLPGMLAVNVELDGRLQRFLAVPPEREPAPAEAKPIDWAPFFRAAQLDMVRFKPTEPQWTPPVATDARVAWTGTYSGATDLPLRVEAGAFHGRLVYFQPVWPWTRSTSLTPDPPTASQSFSYIAYFVGAIFVIIAAIWIAHYNWRAGRGDLRGATRIGIYSAGLLLLAWPLGAHHVASPTEQGLIGDALSNAAFTFVEYWLFYLALEPWVRKYWPQTMISWSRVLAGRWRDPMVGRDVLFGVLFGLLYLLVFQGYFFAEMRGGRPRAGFALADLGGFRFFSNSILDMLIVEVGGSLILFMTLFLARVLLRNQWIAAVVWVAGWAVVRTLRVSSGSHLYLAVLYTLVYSLLVFTLLRFGFFALIVTVFVLDAMGGSFFTTDFSAWYGQSSLLVVILVAAMAILGFRLATASRPLFTGAALENPGRVQADAFKR